MKHSAGPDPFSRCYRSPGLPAILREPRPERPPVMRAAIYCRVSSDAQTVDNQLLELRSYVAARQWTLVGEHCDQGESGSKDRRPALDKLMAEAPAGAWT